MIMKCFLFEIKINFQKYPTRTTKCRDYRSYDPVQLLSKANEIDWTPVYATNNVNTAVSVLQSRFKSLFEKHAPFLEKCFRGKTCSWLDQNAKTEMNTRDGFLRKAKRLNDDQSWRDYKDQRNRCTNLIRKAK